jgi:methionyl-tRNA formyltransferase
MKIFFIGSVQFSLDMLNHLIELEADIVGVYTKRLPNIHSDYVDLSEFCKKNSIACQYTEDINSPVSVRWIKSLNPDIIFCFGWPNLLGEEILNTSNQGVVGFHPTELPRNRGRHPIIWSLVLGLESAGSTFFFMDTGADTGPILSQRRIKIADSDYAADLYEKITRQAKVQLNELLPALTKKTLTPKLQEIPQGNFWRKRTVSDGEIDWRMSARSIRNLIRGLSRPYPGAHFLYEKQEYQVWEADLIDCLDSNMEPGKVLRISDNGPIIRCGDGAICLRVVSPSIVLKEGEYL